MNHIFQNKKQNGEDLAKKSSKSKNQPLNIANLQRAIEDPTIENLNPETMMALQQTHGNQFAAQLTGGTSYPVQAKLTVTEANDSYEQEADATAKQVVAGLNAPVQRSDDEDDLMMKRDTLQRQDEEEELAQPKRLQRVGDEEDEPLQLKRDFVQRDNDEEDDDLQLKRSGDVMGGMDVSSDIESQIEQERGSGQALPDGIRSGLESGFGADFSNVRVHTDSTADNLSRSIQAQAFTTGSDIFFKEGSYDPGSSSGQELLAHELTHTIQQGASPKTEDSNQ